LVSPFVLEAIVRVCNHKSVSRSIKQMSEQTAINSDSFANSFFIYSYILLFIYYSWLFIYYYFLIYFFVYYLFIWRHSNSAQGKSMSTKAQGQNTYIFVYFFIYLVFFVIYLLLFSHLFACLLFIYLAP